jgi:hypothetical protein
MLMGMPHTGEEGGKTFYDWFPKLKRGGIFGGDDYDLEQWPLVKQNVDSFLFELKLDLFIIATSVRDDPYSQYPTWFTIKP